MTITEILQNASYIAIIIGIPIGIYQIFLTRKIAKADLERREKESTIVFTDEIITRVDAINRDIHDVFNDDTINSSDKRYSDNNEIQESIKQYLKLMERLSVGINSGVYNIDVFSRICGRKIVKSYDRLSTIIREKRTKQGNALLYVEFEHMAEILRRRYCGEISHQGDVKGLK